MGVLLPEWSAPARSWRSRLTRCALAPRSRLRKRWRVAEPSVAAEWSALGTAALSWRDARLRDTRLWATPLAATARTSLRNVDELPLVVMGAAVVDANRCRLALALDADDPSRHSAAETHGGPTAWLCAAPRRGQRLRKPAARRCWRGRSGWCSSSLRAGCRRG